jgi:hypothetical protein
VRLLYLGYGAESVEHEKFLFIFFLCIGGGDHSVQSFLSSRLLSRNVKVKIYKTIILPDTIRQIKSRRMKWAGHVAHVGEGKRVQGFGGKA